MTRVLPFRGLRFDSSLVGDQAQVVCPPYDVISPAERMRLQAQNPQNVVQVELPADSPGNHGSRYAVAAETLQAWRADGVLKVEPRPSYYLHETIFAHEGQQRRRRDLLAALGLEPWGAGSVLPHERTMAGPKADRLELLRATRTNVSPVWVLHRERYAALDGAWSATAERAADSSFTVDGEQHRVWVLDDPAVVQRICQAFEQGGPLYIADGHHRYETAFAFSQECAADLVGARETLAVITWADDPGLVVLPTHRILSGLPVELTRAVLQQQWAERYRVKRAGDVGPAALEAALRQQQSQGPVFAMLGPGEAPPAFIEPVDAARLAAGMPGDRSPAWNELDVAVLHVTLVDPLVAATDLHRDEALRYSRDPEEVEAAAIANPGTVGFILNATPVHQVLDVADAADRMPEKSTFFFPKPPTGLVLRDLTLG